MTFSVFAAFVILVLTSVNIVSNLIHEVFTEHRIDVPAFLMVLVFWFVSGTYLWG